MKKLLRSKLLIITVILLSSWFFYHRATARTEWVPVKQGSIISAIYGLGTVTSNKIYTLKIGVTTHVQKLFVQEGDEIKPGQALIQLSDLPLIKANFAGTITSLPVHENETVPPQSEVLTLMDLNDCYILVSLEQEAAIKVQKGQLAKVTFSGLADQVFVGQVDSVYPKAQEVYVKIVVNNLPKTVLPDMSADVAIQLNQNTNSLLVPIKAIRNAQLIVRHNHQIKKIPIQVGAINDDEAEIISNDIQSTDEVLVKT